MDNQAKGKRVFISYLNDDDSKVDTYVTLIEISNGLVVFKTKDNILRIPSNRVLKIKESENDY